MRARRRSGRLTASVCRGTYLPARGPDVMSSIGDAVGMCEMCEMRWMRAGHKACCDDIVSIAQRILHVIVTHTWQHDV
jgi:hypothetical protein